MKLPLPKLLPAMLALLAGMPLAAQESETPIITFKTAVYDNVGAENAFHFCVGAKQKTYIDVDFGFGPVEVEVDVANFDQSTSAMTATSISGSVSAEGSVKIYGDASLIDYLDFEGIYATEMDLSKVNEVEILNLNHNELKALDLSNLTKLQAAYISDNPFTTSPLVIGKNKPDLTILEISNVGAIDQNFDISDYPGLISFDAYATHSLRKITPAGCPDLKRLSIDCTSVSTLDVSKNAELLILDIGETAITDIDLSQNTKLQQFFCSHNGGWMSDYKISTLDLSKNTNLIYLMCPGNNLTTLDVSNNTKLQTLFCNQNYLTTIDISNNQQLNSVNISNNLMDFNTMPLPRDEFIDYYYYQRRLPVERSYAVGMEIDMSDRVIRPDSETWFALFERQRDADGTPADVELPEDYYTFENGKVTLLKETQDSVYLAFANSLFPAYDLQSTLFKVKSVEDYGKDNVAATMRLRPGTKQIELGIGMQGATPENPKKFSIDFGDGNPVEFTTTTNVLPAEPNVTSAISASRPITIYMPEGEALSAFGIDNIGLVSIDVSPSATITDLSITNCKLSSIELEYNCMLTNLDLSGNNLTSIDLESIDGSTVKYSLRKMNLSNNKLTSVTPGLLYCTEVDLSNNQLEEITLLKATNLQTLNLSNNKLATVAIQDLESIKNLNLSNNLLSEIIIADYIEFDNLNISGNRFPMSTLPKDPQAQTYVYAPQQEWIIPAKAPSIDLAIQMLDDATVYTWHTADGKEISGEDKILQNNPGIFQLLDTSLGKIYCTFTNPAFPDFTGENAYRTSEVEVAEKPTQTICTFKTLADGIGELGLVGKQQSNNIFIDWEGNGYLKEYVFTNEVTNFEVNVHANAEVKVYAYEKECGVSVFSLGAGPLEYIDASDLSELIHFSLYGSHLDIDKIKLPKADLIELVISGGELTSTDFLKEYPNIYLMNLSDNKLESIDLSILPKLKAMFLSLNELTSIKIDNPLLDQLAANGNKLTEIDLSGAPEIHDLWLFDNDLHTIDVEGLDNLHTLDISMNHFDFLTLPPVSSVNKYYYGNQKPIEAEIIDGKVDLSGYGAETFLWFIDSPYYDETTGELYGEALEEGDEYTIEEGVTTFKKDFKHVMCVLQNPKFPDLDLYTNFIDVSVDSAINEIESDDAAPATIYDLQGRKVVNPKRGLYIVNGKVVKL